MPRRKPLEKGVIQTVVVINNGQLEFEKALQAARENIQKIVKSMLDKMLRDKSYKLPNGEMISVPEFLDKAKTVVNELTNADSDIVNNSKEIHELMTALLALKASLIELQELIAYLPLEAGDEAEATPLEEGLRQEYDALERQVADPLDGILYQLANYSLLAIMEKFDENPREKARLMSSPEIKKLIDIIKWIFLTALTTLGVDFRTYNRFIESEVNIALAARQTRTR